MTNRWRRSGAKVERRRIHKHEERCVVGPSHAGYGTAEGEGDSAESQWVEPLALRKCRIIAYTMNRNGKSPPMYAPQKDH